ncbi:UTP--GlnB (protein PII) uridylyltransferase, GlnD [Albimonas donghaensis]|uniref:Bifunctional uridylyltransferase/uridylyl-removing enzyme n=1 Tax=Albimonas donghaensis TaxID=356660 RepID=A0A1H2YU23_9RHOB|nr:UTP--GlnB (protein PII) uridylyltransferase, GlnD [Albimonas donghaensis]
MARSRAGDPPASDAPAPDAPVKADASTRPAFADGADAGASEPEGEERRRQSRARPPQGEGPAPGVEDAPTSGLATDTPLIRPAREILEAETTLARLAVAAETAAGEGRDGVRTAAAVVLREALESGHAAIREGLEARPWAGGAVARSIAWLTDEVVRLSLEVGLRWLHPSANPTEGERVAVLAVGGYGRFEMAPYSDVDLLFLTHWKRTPWVESLVESVLYLLWDLRLKVGHSTRTVDDCVRLAGSDITIRTALLEHRCISGDTRLVEDLETRLWTGLFSRTGPEFVEAKLDERGQRHQRQGGTRYLLEPNVKESKGGLRDLQTLWWIAKYLYHAGSPRDLAEKGVFTEDEVAVFSEAEEFLWTVRCHLHYLSGRANEQLSFDMQVDVARRLGFEDNGGQRGVERFMQRYFQHAKAVGELTRIFLAALEAAHVKKRPTLGTVVRNLGFGGASRNLTGPFRIRDGRLDFPDEATILDDPLNILRIFDEALRTGTLVHPSAMRVIAANLDLIDDDLRANPVANRIFLHLLVDCGDPERALRRMNETGVLGAFIPEWGRIHAMMQFNMYHHYTVDEHSIMAVSILARIERGRLKEDLPVASAILAQGVDRVPLYVAMFLHDIGKGMERDHSEVGEEIARVVCPRLGLDDAQTDTVCWLVRNHLLMSDVAQKRDISDPTTVRAFAAEVRTPSRLNLLLVLTACDIMAVGPDVWNNWKAQLLRSLHRRTREVLTGGSDSQSRTTRLAEAQDEFRAGLSDWSPEAVEAEVNRYYRPFFLGLPLETQLVFARLGQGARPEQVLSDITPEESRDATRACFYMSDHPGLFARLSGALALAGANVLDARTVTTSDGVSCSVFWIQDSEGNAYESARLDRLRKAVDRALKGEVVAREALKPKRKVKKRESKFNVPTRVLFDNASSELYTVVEVDTRDRVGLLYDLTRALAGCNVTIASAIIATYGEQAVDVFYVKDLFGLKITAANKMKQIESRLRDAVEAAAPDSDEG